MIPIYNGEAHLPFALESVVAEAGEGVECIVVDDGSSDRSVDVARSFKSRIPLTMLEGPRRANWVAATNAGLRHATAPFGCFLHQDDMWLAGRLERVRRLIESFPRAALWVQGASFVDDDGRPLGRWVPPVPVELGTISSTEFVRRLLVQNFLAIAAPVFRIEDVTGDGLDESLWYTADWDLWLRLGGRGDVACDKDPAVAFRIHRQSQTSRRTAATDDMREQLERVFEHHFTQWSTGHPSRLQRSSERAGRVAIELNVALASASHGDYQLLWPAGRSFVRLGVRGAVELLRNSRLAERIVARLRMEIRARRALR